MNNVTEELLPLLKEDTSTSWVAEQIQMTFRQGISMNVRESLADVSFYQLVPSDITTKERAKREKYETTRSYSVTEKELIIINALKTLYLELPAIQLSALETLKEFGLDTTSIEFVPPDEPELGVDGHSIEHTNIYALHKLLKDNFQMFERELQ